MVKDSYLCSLNLANDLVGGKWKMRVIWHISIGNNRYSSLEKGIPDINHRMLALTLRELERDGIITRRIIDEIPIRVDYEFTEQGRQLIRAINELNEWAIGYAKTHKIQIGEE